MGLAHVQWRLIAAMAAALLFSASARTTCAVTPEGPEVKQLVERALKRLDTESDERLGARCLMGLAYYKAGRKLDHPRIVEAQKACESAINEPAGLDNYSVGLALIFLLEAAPERNHSLAGRYVTEVLKRQQAWGSWGYEGSQTGDTSQTQYPTLGLWLAINNGHSVPNAVVEKDCLWLLRTQDPSGAWGYQGQDPGHFNRVTQSEIRPSLVAAGLGSLYITADTLGLLQTRREKSDARLPPALKRVGDPLAELETRSSTIDTRLVRRAVTDGNRWFSNHYTMESEAHTYYYLYAFERYQSFREAAEGRADTNPAWYNDIYNYLRKKQEPDGSWNDSDGVAVATSFCVLTLLRSTKKTLVRYNVNVGQGVLLGGMGLPPKTADLVERDGRIVETPLAGNLDELLNLLERGDRDDLRQLSELSGNMTLEGDVTRRSGQIARLRALVSSGPYEARLVAVRALSRIRDFDNVPILIYALKDPDMRIVHEADQALRFISRKLAGVGLPDEPRPHEVPPAILAWKTWYQSVRPDAEFLD
jgi:hypothetical protein